MFTPATPADCADACQSPIIHGPDDPPDVQDRSCTEDIITDTAIEADVDGKGCAHQFTAETDVGDKQHGSIEDKLQVLADEMETRRECESHGDLDRELGFDVSDAFFVDRVGERGERMGAVFRPPPGADVHPNGPHFHPPRLKTTVAKGTCTPPVPSYFPPRYAHNAPSVDGAPLANAADDTEERGGAHRPHLRVGPPSTSWATPDVYVPPTNGAGTIAIEAVTPSDGDFFHPRPSAPVQHEAPLGNTNSLPVPTDTQSYPGGNRRLHGSHTPSGIHQHVPLGQLHSQDFQSGHEGGGGVNSSGQFPGYAVAHARRRLQAIRTARRGMAAENDSPKGPHESLLRSSVTSTDVENTHPQPCDGAHSLLGRLKDTRRQYSLSISR